MLVVVANATFHEKAWKLVRHFPDIVTHCTGRHRQIELTFAGRVRTAQLGRRRR